MLTKNSFLAEFLSVGLFFVFCLALNVATIVAYIAAQ